MKTIIITEAALPAASHPDFPAIDLLAGTPPVAFENLVIREGPDSILVATRTCDFSSRLLVLGSGLSRNLPLLPVEEHATLFDRSVRFGLRSFNKAIALSPNSMPYRKGSRSSAFASGASTLRIIAEEGFQGSRNVYVYDLEEAAAVQDLAQHFPDPNAYERALSSLPELFDTPAPPPPNDGPVELGWQTGDKVAKGFAYDEWLPLLSKEQKNFVLEREITGPLRVRGAAGTGKTLSMVLKALTVAKTADGPVRILFLTHSWAVAGKVDELVRSVGRDIPGAKSIDVYPLMELARQRDYSLVGRRPLGLDSEAGITEALKVISELVDSFKTTDWVAYRSGCSAGLAVRMDAAAGTRERRDLHWDLLSEFGGVFAAEGLLARGTDRERYLRVRRMAYMMRLETPTDREVVFALWRSFLSYLRENGLIATDQIISDYLNDLRTFFWEAKRSVDGYDYVFVDEMHLFNAQERLVFHNLLADGDASPKVVMALDPRQSPREVFAGIEGEEPRGGTSIYERAQLHNPGKVDFLDVYRSTPELTRLTRTVLDAVPALDMGDDWALPIGGSMLASGPLPQYKVVADIAETFGTAIATAKSLQNEARRHDGQVAILCMDYDRFLRLREPAQAQNRKSIFIISSRDDVERLRFLSQRIVFSTPEYVAGLQFDTVVLIDANADLVPDGAYSGAAERRFLSELYLGLSRAERRVVVLASRDGGGLTRFLAAPASKGLMEPL
jgi:hypothetical protein